jgi:hypothetical protein
MAKRKYIFPAYLSVLKDGVQAFRHVEEVLADPELRGQAVHLALAELEPWFLRYGDFLVHVGGLEQPPSPAITAAATIARVRKKAGDDWPTAGPEPM